jgi:uncharacterized protein (DUF488 family)
MGNEALTSNRHGHEIAGPAEDKEPMPAFDLFSIGHSNIPAERFVAMLQSAGVTLVADVRSVPASRHFPWFSKHNLKARLAEAAIGHMTMGDALGGRTNDPALFRDGIADYEAMARRPEFASGLDRLLAAAAQERVCLMCAEREPLDCHRCLLVARRLAERGCAVGHILHDGSVEPHAATEQRLLALAADDCDLFAAGQDDRLAAAYRSRARAVAFRQKSVTKRAAGAKKW